MDKTDNLTLFEKLLIIQEKLEAVMKDSTNPFYKSSYASLKAHYSVAKPLLLSYRLFVRHEGRYIDGVFNMVTVISDEGGECIECPIPVIATKLEATEQGKKEAIDDPQAQGSSITYARRYGLSCILAMETEDDDGNNGSGKKVIETVHIPYTPTKIPDLAQKAMDILQTTVASDICPLCESQIVLRKGKMGNFYGCSNYPNCKYTRKA